MRFQIVIDCASPDLLVPFWAAALRYEPLAAPTGFATWRDYYLSVGVPAEELGDGDAADRLTDPAGAGPDVWVQVVAEGKVAELRTGRRIHLDLMPTDRTRDVCIPACRGRPAPRAGYLREVGVAMSRTTMPIAPSSPAWLRVVYQQRT